MYLFDEFIPAYAAPDFLYTIYIPLIGFKEKFWTVADVRLVSEDALELVHVSPMDYKNIKVVTYDQVSIKEEECKALFLALWQATRSRQVLKNWLKVSLELQSRNKTGADSGYLF